MRDTVFKNATFVMSLPPRPEKGEDFCNKGLQRIGFERGYWTEEGRDVVTNVVFSKGAMIRRLNADEDFSKVKTILEEFFDNQDHVSYILNAKFWCDLQWIEQYWNDVKREVREKCDYTLPALKAHFPPALESVPIQHIRNYQRRSFDIMQAMREIGRNGDFARIPGLQKEYKSHRRLGQIRLGLATEPTVRDRNSWGPVLSARPLT